MRRRGSAFEAIPPMGETNFDAQSNAKTDLNAAMARKSLSPLMPKLLRCGRRLLPARFAFLLVRFGKGILSSCFRLLAAACDFPFAQFTGRFFAHR
jgi:hypothetical protein